MVCRYFIGKEKKIIKLPLTVGLIYRFFVIVLIAVTIFWVPIIETTHSEHLFINMQVVLSSLVPPVAAIFLLAVFCRRVTEQVGGCWYGHGLPSHHSGPCQKCPRRGFSTSRGHSVASFAF